MDIRDLLQKMNMLGFPMLETEREVDANEVLYEAVKAEDVRIKEGFPVVLANAAKQGKFDYNKALDLCKDKKHKDAFLDFMVLSLSLYRYYNLKFWWAKEFYRNLSPGQKDKFDKFLLGLRHDQDFIVGGCRLNTLRLKNVFENYFFEKDRAGAMDLTRRFEELSLEYALSQVFSPKQKVLFLKRLKGQKMTKTEQEYYSRAVKKKVLALANLELHKLSRALLDR